MIPTLTEVVERQREDIRKLHPRSVWDMLGIDRCRVCDGDGEARDSFGDIYWGSHCRECGGTGRADGGGVGP